MNKDPKNNKTIFQKALGVFKKDSVRGPEDSMQQAPLNYTPNINNVSDSLTRKQQEFLDWQVTTINKDLYSRAVYYDSDRIVAYNDFRAMDMSPEIAAALTIIRDECLVRNERGNILEIYSQNPRVKEVLKNLFKERLNVDYNMRLWIRELCKYGDFFLHLHIDGVDRKGVYDVMALPAEEIHREDNVDGIAGNTRFKWDTKNMYFEDWQIAHFRLIEDVKRLPYGTGILNAARKLWKQLQLAEDAMLVYRLVRAPQRTIFYIDVGNINDQDVKQYIDTVKSSMKKQPVVNMQQGGTVNLKYNPAAIEDNYYIPIRGDKSSKVENLEGAANMDQIQDIEYLEKKLFAALQVPKPYLNYTESMPGGTMLAQADLRFSRMINSIQEAVLMELRRIANVHLLFMGFEDDLDNFTLQLTNPSTQQELLHLETWKTRLEVYKDMCNAEVSSPASYTWAMENILGFSKEEIKLMLKQKKIEKKLFAEIETAVETYKNIGLFDDLNKKFEKIGVVSEEPSIGAEEETPAGGESLEAGSMESSLGTEEAPAETPEATPVPEEAPLAEIKKRKSDLLFESALTELLGEDKKDELPQSSLLTNNKILSTKTTKLKESMKSVESLISKRKDENIKKQNEVTIDEDKFDFDSAGKDSSLLNSNVEMNHKTQESLKRLKKIINKNNGENKEK